LGSDVSASNSNAVDEISTPLNRLEQGFVKHHSPLTDPSSLMVYWREDPELSMKKYLLAFTGVLLLFGNSALAQTAACRIGTPRQDTNYKYWGTGDPEATIWVFKVSIDPDKIDVDKTMKNLLLNGKLTANNAVRIVAPPYSRGRRTDFGEADGYVVSAPNSAGVNTTLVLYARTACSNYAVYGYNPKTRKLFGNCGNMEVCHDYINNTVTTYRLHDAIYDLNDNRIKAIAIVKEVKRLTSKSRYGGF